MNLRIRNRMLSRYIKLHMGYTVSCKLNVLRKVVLRHLTAEQTASTTKDESNMDPQEPTDAEEGRTETVRAKYVVGCDGNPLPPFHAPR
jgi:2-polyprenyl-6-methoxyphenol hydroxylase-like FAD-dependent oxidoreductase